MNHNRVEQLVNYWAEYYMSKAADLAGQPYPVTVTCSYRKSKTAGMAHVGEITRYGRRRITLNIPLLAYNDQQSQIQETVGHEIAHLVAYELYDDRGHGRRWKDTMVKFGLEPNRCHTMNQAAAAVGKNTTVYVYQCNNCGNHVTCGSKRHQKQQYYQRWIDPNGGMRHRCGNRKTGSVHFVAKSDKRTFARFQAGEIQSLTGATATTGGPRRRTKTSTTAVAARTTKPATKRASSGQPSKLQQSRAIFQQMHQTHSRKQIINRMVTEVGCTQAGAATYYAKLKKEIAS